MREAFGAALAVVQAARAEVMPLRASFRTIAAEELAHAEPSRAVARWLGTRLSAEARARANAAREEALAQLRAEIEAGAIPTCPALGMPRRDEALALLDALVPTLVAA